ncbi:MAG TPA: hypothetical protein VMD52_07510 [Patescibacteria group bacterium]|nr:hypothetical protein [Patescibacteria group bacterium]
MAHIGKALGVCGAALWIASAFAAPQSEFVYDVQGKRNPFIPLVTADGRLLKLETEAGKTPGLSLEGIVYDRYGMSYALVNGEPVRVGDMAGEYQVLKIEKNKVIFVKEGQTLEMVLKKEEE